MDLLHPQAKLSWKNCCKLPSQWPTHCAALQNTVAVLTYYGDLFISKDLKSWTKSILKYSHMSLTTYQSKFVVVGGQDRYTGETTNSVLTSSTGLEWEPSLPKMPTMRYHTSSVSTRVPEILVVAGGKGLNDKVLDIVEVLQGDKWTAVDPLPAPVHSMHSTVHDGNLHFMGGSKQGTAVFSCNIFSLTSSVTEPTSKTSTTSPLWTKYEAPHGKTTAVSYCSRLASIDYWGIIRGFSTTTKSWEEVTTTGDTPPHQANRFMAATVLTTREIVFCNNDGQVYKISLSGESYMQVYRCEYSS